jgi:peptidyl-tRNA hydrolase, PTH1 family
MKYLIVGLGNPGKEYEDTRHNIGFNVLDAIAQKRETSFEVSRLGDVASVRFKGRTLVLLKPATFMNLSGKAVRYWMEAEKIPLDRVLIVTDDLAMPFGSLRLRGKGGAGGHNGLENIETTLQTPSYSRLRFGIGSDFPQGQQVDYVLGKWGGIESAALTERLTRCDELICSFTTAGLDRTMNTFNNT